MPVRAPFLRLSFITCVAVLVHGYHLGVDDAEIYVPAIKKVADPSLYPFGAEFFASHARLSFFSDLIGNSARLTRLPADFVIFVWHVACIFLLLLACWRLLCACFQNDQARWSGVLLVAGALSVPVAGTALAIMDPYLTARSLSTPATLFAIACYLSNRPKTAGAWLLLTVLIHPQMGVYGATFLAFLAWSRRPVAARVPVSVFGLFLLGFPLSFNLQPAHGVYREVLFTRSYFFVSTWAWYEWIGIFAPLALLWWFSAITPRGTSPAFRSLAGTLVPFGLLFTAAGTAIAMSDRLQSLARLQPMRSFHLIYVVFFSLLGGLIGEYLLKDRIWPWLALFVPLGASMWLLQQSSFSSSSHVEWPGSRYRNTWTSAFLWIRDYTPKNAIFALDPNYMRLPGEDQHGFRALAERSALADTVKDSGAVSLFPQLADDWAGQVQAQRGWEGFSCEDFENLAKHYPVNWILTKRPGPIGLACPYGNRDLVVCQLNPRHSARIYSGAKLFKGTGPGPDH